MSALLIGLISTGIMMSCLAIYLGILITRIHKSDPVESHLPVDEWVTRMLPHDESKISLTEQSKLAKLLTERWYRIRMDLTHYGYNLTNASRYMNGLIKINQDHNGRITMTLIKYCNRYFLVIDKLRHTDPGQTDDRAIYRALLTLEHELQETLKEQENLPIIDEGQLSKG